MPKVKKQTFETTLSSLSWFLAAAQLKLRMFYILNLSRSPITQDSEQSLFPRKTEHTFETVSKDSVFKEVPPILQINVQSSVAEYPPYVFMNLYTLI